MVFPFFTVSSELPKLQKDEQKARNALLADIQQGTRLRKVTQINDRSAPQIEKPKGSNRDGVSPAINKGGSQQPLGGLFAGGFPVLRPAGQRDMPGGRPGQLPGVRAVAPKAAAPPNSAAKAGSSPSNPSDSPGPAVPPEPPSTSRAGTARPSLPVPPPPPPAASKPSLTFPPPPPLPPPAERPTKGGSPNSVPLPPLPPQADKPTKLPVGASQLPPPPPPLPPCGFPARTTDFSTAASSPSEARDYPPPTPPLPAPPPLPPPPLPAFPPTSNRLSFPPSPAISSAGSGGDVPPPLPPKSPHLLSHLHKPSNIQSLPLPPTPPLPQPAAVVETRKKRPGRGPGAGAGKLAIPPQPPARSPTTELTSKSGVSAWATVHDPYPPLKNGNMHIIDDFESKFTFHSVEDFPPPDEFKPFQKIYPSKIPRDPSKNPPLRTHVR
ncbi:WAS/WASL-interacting protein family member 3 isoform X2 [Lagopus muta]|uniref:WAS/WASL-interacting protein family member 3 isoform X2 n=1 Tax=Lagopus muta TaxID=64668 RepID=UPI00209F5ECA|nr:WAS/WASL-interacting protein family member 3 isoform X2 [Lagopus muta]